MDKMREEVRRSSSNLRTIPKDRDLRVRYLSEPDQWLGYVEGYDAAAKTYFPLEEGMQQQPGVRFSKKYLANVVIFNDENDNKGVVAVLKIPKTLALRFMMRVDRYGSVTDRDYTLTRLGDGLDTTYELTPETKKVRRLDTYTPLDLYAVLEAEADAADAAKNTKDERHERGQIDNEETGEDEDEEDDDDEDEDEDESGDAANADDGDDDDEDEDEDEEDEDGDEDEDDEEDDEDEDEEDEDGDEDEDDEDEDDEAGEEGYDEADLKAMGIAQLRALAKEMGLKSKTGASKATLVALVWEALDED